MYRILSLRVVRYVRINVLHRPDMIAYDISGSKASQSGEAGIWESYRIVLS